jgi:hypothetical protein
LVRGQRIRRRDPVPAWLVRVLVLLVSTRRSRSVCSGLSIGSGAVNVSARIWATVAACRPSLMTSTRVPSSMITGLSHNTKYSTASPASAAVRRSTLVYPGATGRAALMVGSGPVDRFGQQVRQGPVWRQHVLTLKGRD